MKLHPDIKIYGNTKYRGSCATESAEQTTFFNWLRREFKGTYGDIAIHPRNEGKRTYNQAHRQKSEGLTKGASDIIVPGYPAFVCELKRRDHTKSKLEDEQIVYLLAAKGVGAFACIALGSDAAKEAFIDWLKVSKPW